jgi:predicted MPP superfamily phosphohydrolase
MALIPAGIKIDVTRVDLPVRRLPKLFEGRVACQLSDLHLDSDRDLRRFEEAIRIVQSVSPDIIFLTGDYFSDSKSMSRYIGELRRILTQLDAPLGVFATTGNHDHIASFWSVAQALTDAGARLLENDSHAVRIGASRLFVVGIGDLWSQRARPSRAFRGLRSHDCNILLVHNPDIALYVRHMSPGVIVSGHTHGGIIRFPFFGPPLRSFLRIGRRFYSGLNRYRDFYIYTNRGLGAFPLGLRVNCRPEVAVFTLRSDTGGATGDDPGENQRKANEPRRKRIAS